MYQKSVDLINDMFIDDYPYPIAVTFNRIKSNNNPAVKYKALFATTEAIARLIGSITLAEIRRQMESGTIKEVPISIKNDFRRTFSSLSFGSWIQYAREGLKLLKKEGCEIVIPDLLTLFYDEKNKETDFKKDLDWFSQTRNVDSHSNLPDKSDSRPLNDYEFQNAFSQAAPILENIINCLYFLEQTSFGLIRSIDVKKSRTSNPQFIHRIGKLAGTNLNQEKTIEAVYADVRDSGSVIIRYDDNDNYMNLTPFYVFEEKDVKAPDIFYYSTFKNNNTLYFASCGQDGNNYFELKTGSDGKLSQQEDIERIEAEKKKLNEQLRTEQDQSLKAEMRKRHIELTKELNNLSSKKSFEPQAKDKYNEEIEQEINNLFTLFGEGV